ncbi:AbrB/MazE/SpoVT family DNA-binding domain-containing protein [Candidatus Woesearchaeota archaeon]|nr:AbrB/MazE/SpoVT family DNA-binding domain-containing protein [Candidatus Woesearchaeota archaeon]
MKRKVIQIAKSTQLVSLPRAWTKKYNIQKGDELDIEEESNKLIVSTEKNVILGTKEVDVTNLDRLTIIFFIRSLYKIGYDEMTITFKNQVCLDLRNNKQVPVMEVITREVSRLNGVEIFTQKEGYCIIKTISEDSAKAFDNMLRRIFLLLEETFRELEEGYNKGDKTILQGLQRKHDVITKFISYSERLLNKVGYKEIKKRDLMFHQLEVLDMIIDILKHSSRYLEKHNFKASPEGLLVYQEITSCFKIFYDLYYNFDFKRIVSFNRKRYEVLDMFVLHEKKISKKEYYILSNLYQILEQILNLINTRVVLEF